MIVTNRRYDSNWIYFGMSTCRVWYGMHDYYINEDELVLHFDRGGVGRIENKIVAKGNRNGVINKLHLRGRAKYIYTWEVLTAN